jgi:hypothetical protein
VQSNTDTNHGHHRKHRCPPCDRGWGRVHGWRATGYGVAPGAFEACVIRHESTFNRYASNGVDFSYYQWEPATLEAAERAAGVRVYGSPFDAPLSNQTAAFRAYEPGHRTAWPRSVPECGGYCGVYAPKLRARLAPARERAANLHAVT